MYKIGRHLSLILSATAMGAVLAVPIFVYEGSCFDTAENLNRALFSTSIFAILGLLVTTNFRSPQAHLKISYSVFLITRWIIALTIFKHAMSQIYGIEFGLSYFTLEEKMVNYTPRQLAHIFYAYNPNFQKIFGTIFLLSAVGLCFRRTVLLSSFILVPYFVHIILINIAFELCHTLDASILLIGLIGILIYYRHRLVQFFFNKSIKNEIKYPFYDPPTKQYHNLTILKAILIIGHLILLNNERFAQIDRWWFHDSPIIQGVWKIDTLKTNKTEVPKFEKFFFEKGRRGIATVENDTMSGFQYIIDTSYNQLELWNFHEYRDLDFKGKYHILGEDLIEYNGTNKKDSLYILLSRIPEYDRVKKVKSTE